MDESGNSPETKTLAARVRESLAEKKLPTEFSVQVWVGPGSVKPCHGCGERIRRAQTEYELEGPGKRTFRLHAECHGLWLAELIRRGWWKPELPTRRARLTPP